VEYKDYYKTLGVEKSTPQADLKKAYKQLAKKYHPDKNKGDKLSEEKFKNITEAYEVIGNEKNRKKYDQLGANWKNYRDAGFGGSGFNFNGNMGDMFGGSGGGGFSDFFNNFFNGSQQQSGFNRPQKGRIYSTSISITLAETYTGAEKVVVVDGNNIKLNIKPGILDQHKLKVGGKGAPSKNGGPSGDLIITVNVISSGQLIRKDNDLYLSVDVDLYTMVLGGKVDVTLPDNKKISLNVSETTQNGKKLKLRGAGFRLYNNQTIFGDCFLELNCKLPEKISYEEKELFNSLRVINLN
jgi:curved DNA-binding protein